MSEKRFRKVMGFIRDNTLEGGDVEGVMDLTEIEDMLNKQQATIKHLTIEKHQADKRFQAIIAELKKENEQLKKERRKDAKEFSALFKQNFGLKKENEELKKQLRICKQQNNPIKIWYCSPIKKAGGFRTTTIDDEYKKNPQQWRWSE